MPLYGHELSRDVFPAQAGLGRVVAFGKPIDFVGRAASEEGPSGDAPVLVGLVGEGRRAARADYTVLSGDDEVGVVTSGVLSPTLGVLIAMAYVAPASAQPGTALAVDIRGTRLPMTVTELPSTRERRTDMAVPTELQYTSDHEWIRVDGEVATVGITAYAADKLGDVVFVELPEAGARVEGGSVVGEIESTKSVGELFAPSTARSSRPTRPSSTAPSSSTPTRSARGG